MARQKRRKSKRRRHDQDTGRSWLQTYGLAIGLVALLAVIGLGAILRGRAGNSAQPTDPTAEVNLDKSIGPADAPVVVVEYGDFQ